VRTFDWLGNGKAWEFFAEVTLRRRWIFAPGWGPSLRSGWHLKQINSKNNGETNRKNNYNGKSNCNPEGWGA
jgi:hypothetical protein